MKAGLIGQPVSHSKSPLIHGFWMKQHGIKGTYELFDVAKADLGALIERLIAAHYDGFNVTVPHKENIMQFCDVLDDNARQIGAVNTVKIIDRQLHGYNTDAYGFTENLKQSIPDLDLKNKSALVLGAGGAARAVIQGLKNEGVGKIYLTNRTLEKAEKLKDDFTHDDKCIIECIEWDKRTSINSNINLLVNTTSLGMVGRSVLEFDVKGLGADTIVNDIVYNPLQTELLNNAERAGLKTVTGIGMLLHQARPAFALWTGINPNVNKDLMDLITL